MEKKIKKFKSPPKKYQPRGLTVVYEDHDLILVDKVAGLATASNDKANENTAYYRLTDYVKRGVAKSKNRIHLIHHLDKEASGLLIFAKTLEAKKSLLARWATHGLHYVAVVHGVFEEQEGDLEGGLVENSIHKMFVANASHSKAQPASTHYKVMQHSANYSLLELQLKTDVKHQVRAQLAHAEHPIVLDKIYGEKGNELRRIGLHGASITFLHPYNGEEMHFESRVPGHFYALTAAKA